MKAMYSAIMKIFLLTFIALQGFSQVQTVRIIVPEDAGIVIIIGSLKECVFRYVKTRNLTMDCSTIRKQACERAVPG